MRHTPHYVPAPFPLDEPQRLEALRQLNILDTAPEQAFDDIAELARVICDKPIALVSLLDSDRQWFKSCLGLDATQTPRDMAFCGFAILEKDRILEVQDTRLDPRFADNPLVREAPNIRFYAGIPLVMKSGHALGTLCLIDTKPGCLTDMQRQALTGLGRQVVKQIELRQLAENHYSMASRFTELSQRAPGLLFELVYHPGAFTLQYAGERAEQMLGIACSDLYDDVNVLLRHLVPEDRRAVRRAFLASCRSVTMVDVIFRASVLGQERWFRIEASPQKDDTTLAWYGFLSDITLRQQGRLEIEAERAMYQRVMSAASSGIVACNEQGELTVFNEAAYRWHGVDVTAVPQSEWGQYYDLYEQDATTPMSVERIPLVRALGGETLRDEPMVIARNDQEVRYVSANADPIFSPDGRPLGAVAIMHDVTARVLSERALALLQQRFTQAFETAPIGMALVSLEGWIVDANDALCRLLGYSLETLRTLKLRTLMNVEDWQHELPFREEMLNNTRQHYRIEGRYHARDGSELWTEMQVSLLRDAHGAPDQFITQILDITEQHRASRMKDEFIATVSHELRTPLTSISAALGMLDSGVLGSLPSSTATEMIRIAHESSERLKRLISDLLDMERISAGQMNYDLAPQAIEPLLKACLDECRIIARQSHITLGCTLSFDGLVKADEARLKQVLINLLSNAIRFSPEGSHVQLASEQRDGMVRLSVTDNGAGIPDAFKPMVFKKFVQVDGASTRRHGGAGLGLAISKELVEGMGGGIGFTSVKDEGSCFYVLLPRG
ncbi:PAS domain S-box protein [Larsenimonas rhizosphaerae]|uniref:histidine kinase n=1 Tax=Larsenimonas rhizosphaerae TaxID=2944682 RepID=A0AA41ZHQ7_9GAMM|nr:PAS domain S-box protein [Larsenimonas rhizosphaerae]MCM2131762.1 PAS domain S-box protein [Larsenimonas rhizosphaerae]MCX2524911.1 PAS domain S-box protein [Larsenimonas rhizosphaerae]